MSVFFLLFLGSSLGNCIKYEEVIIYHDLVTLWTSLRISALEENANDKIKLT